MYALLALSREWVTYEGVEGYRFTGSNGKTLFLPGAGYRLDSSLYSAVPYGYYWSSTLLSQYSDKACYLFFDSGDADWTSVGRYYGHSVRPVTE